MAGRAFSIAAFLAFCLGVLAGCDGHLVGMRDVELDYRATTIAKNAPEDELRQKVALRLHAANLAVDVESTTADAGTEVLRVSADEASIEEVDALLTWTGGLRVYELDPEASIDPKHPEELVAHEEAAPSGGTEHYYVGPASAVNRAAHLTPPETGHRLLVDASSSAATKEGFARTRVAKDPALVDLSDGITSAVAHGPTLRLTLSERARSSLAIEGRSHRGRPVAFARDTSILAVTPIEEAMADGALTLALGASPRAYTRAALAANLLQTPTLPRLARTLVTRKPPAYALASAEIVLPLVLSLAWLAFVRRFDRARPEPLWLVLVTFALGGAAVVPVSLLEWRIAEVSPYLNPQLMTFGGQIAAFPRALAVFALTVGLAEEGAKLLAAWVVARQRREFDEPVDGIIYACASALGFAAIENVRYFAAGRVAGDIVVTRAFMTAPAHFLFASLWGYALGQKLIDPKKSVWPLFLLSVLAHGAFDACLSFPATARLAPAINLVLASCFVVMLRKALRHGPIDPDRPPRARGTLDVYPVGSRGLFVLFVLAMHGSAAALFFLGVYAEQTPGRVGAAFLLASTLLLALVAMSAYGVSASLPLDVVLDDAGVTFAGAFFAWSSVVRLERRPASNTGLEITLVGPSTRLSLTPVDPRSVDNLVASLYARMARATKRGGGEPIT